MIVFVKESKLTKLSPTLFSFLAVSSSDVTKDDYSIADASALMPPADIFAEFVQKRMKAKTFDKKYRKYLSKNNTLRETMIYAIGKCINAGHNVALVCSDEEFRTGYLKILAAYIGNFFGVEVRDVKDANETMKDVFETLDLGKKAKNYLNDPANVGEKKFKKLTKKIFNAIGDEFDNDSEFNKLAEKYAVDDMVCMMAAKEVITLNKEFELGKINATSDIKAKALIKCLETAEESDKDIKKIIKEAKKSHDIKKYKKLDTETLISFVCEVYKLLCIFRENGGKLED